MHTRTVLFVDDDAQLRVSLARTLRREPYQLITVGGAVDALAILRACLIDVIVCDEAMPGMLGTEFLASIRHEFPEVVTILLTGYGSLEVAQRAVNAGGVYRLLSKPCDTEVLTQAIRDALKHGTVIERMRLLAQRTGAAPPMAAAVDHDSYGASAVFEVEDTSVDLHQLLAELETEFGVG